jgi:predicted HTH transcriptional regulator
VSLINFKIDEINLDIIKSLIDDEVCESKYIEYKRELNIENKAEKAEFLNDLTAMSNSEGGDIIYGIEEERGIPVKISEITIEDTDELMQKIENTLRDNITPRIKYYISFIETSINKYLIIIRLPKSLNAPHMVTSSGFYIRNISGKHKMSVDELRECFMTSAGYSKEAYLFHFKDELDYNRNALRSMLAYLFDKSPVPNAFEALNIGSKHLRLEAWNAIVRAGLLPLLTFERQKAFQYIDKSIRDIIRIIQMENAEWKRIIEHHNMCKTSGAQQVVNLDTIYSQRKCNLNEKINKALSDIEITLKEFE